MLMGMAIDPGMNFRDRAADENAGVKAPFGQFYQDIGEFEYGSQETGTKRYHGKGRGGKV